MHVLFLGKDYPPFASGVGAYMQNMARALVQEGHRATVLCEKWAGQPGHFVDNGVYVYRHLEPHRLYSRDTVRTVLEIANQESVDFIEGADHLGLAAQLFSQKKRPPIIIKAHSSNALKVLRESQIVYGWQRPILWLSYLKSIKQIRYEYLCYKKADYLIAPSTAIINSLEKQGIVLPARKALIYNPIDPEHFISSASSNFDNKTILFAGRLDFGKGIGYLPQIMRNLRGTGLRLKIAGGDSYVRGLGSMKNWLKEKLGPDIADVEFLGQVQSPKMNEVFQMAKGVIVPSRWDNFPTVILEAMKFRKPVVASPYGGMPEMLSRTLCEAIDPSSIKFTENINRIVSDTDFSIKAGASMFNKLISSYTPSKVIKSYCAFLGGSS
jgi:glycosyltransferase involved in cell wall biosynthesis